MATDRFISHNRAFHTVSASVLNIGTLINYSPDAIIKVYKIGFSNANLKGWNPNTLLAQTFICNGVRSFEPTIPSDIYNLNSDDIFDGNIAHGSSGLPVRTITNAELDIPCTTRNLFRNFYYYSDDTLASGWGSSAGLYAKYLLMPQYQLIYECDNNQTQPIILRQNDGIFILNTVYTQANKYTNTYFEFTIE